MAIYKINNTCGKYSFDTENKQVVEAHGLTPVESIKGRYVLLDIQGCKELISRFGSRGGNHNRVSVPVANLSYDDASGNRLYVELV